MEEVRAEILAYFKPQEESYYNGRTCYRWARGNNSLEVVIPAYKFGDYTNKKAQIVMNSRRHEWSRCAMSSSHEYTLDALYYLLHVLNRPHR